MKRKRGNKKSKSKKRPEEPTNNEPVEKVNSDNAENSSGAAGDDSAEGDSEKEIEATTVVEKEQTEKIADTNSDIAVNKPTGNLVYGRMKVRIKTSKVLDSQVTAANATPTPTRSDTDMGSQEVLLEKNEKPSAKIEDHENSFPETNTPISEFPPKKVGSIKIKSSKNMNSSVIKPCTSALAQNEEIRPALAQNEEIHPKESVVLRTPRSSELELKAALETIKKIMKMDAAEPFNTPVNPIALGIPDYLDVIDTPMDFGTICSNLEGGNKYKTAEEVYKDVEYVWNNCYKYNKKGDYVVELMKRVKKNFTKYWITAGLYIDQPQGSSGADVTQSHDSNAKMQGESGHLIQKKRPGVKRHKDDCLCAICKMMRRRQEREELLRGEENSYPVQEGKLEGWSQAESPYQYTSSNMEISSGPDADSDLEEKGEVVKLENTELQYTPMQERVEILDSNLDKQIRGVEMLGSSQLEGEGFGEKNGGISACRNDVMLIETPQTKTLHENSRTAMVDQRNRKVNIDKIEMAHMLKKLQRFENPQLVKLCETLFTNDVKSVWNGPHSLGSHQACRSSSIHAAINSFLN